MQRIYAAPEILPPDWPAPDARVCLTGETRHRLVDVLRLTVGKKLRLFDGRGVEVVGIVSGIDRGEVAIQVEAPFPSPEPPCVQLTLAMSMLKREKMDWGMQKSVELGAARIEPLQTVRTVPVVDGARVERQRRRWQRIATQAAEQCERPDVPEVFRPTPLAEWLESWSHHAERGWALIERDELPELGDTAGGPPQRAALVVGPEGGWTAEERQQLIDAGLTAVRLGPRILRAETAAVAALAILVDRWRM